MLFPNYKITPEEKEKDLQTLENQTPILKQKANFYIEGLCFIVIGFTSTATFYLVSSCLKDFSQNGCWYGLIWGGSGIFIIRH